MTPIFIAKSSHLIKSNRLLEQICYSRGCCVKRFPL